MSYTNQREKLPAFLQTLGNAKLEFYNAGTDILDGDPLGMLKVGFQDVVERDRYVLEQLKPLGTPLWCLPVAVIQGNRRDWWRSARKWCWRVKFLCLENFRIWQNTVTR